MAAKKGLQATIVDYTDYTASFHCAVSYLLCAGIQQNKLIAMLKHVTCTEAVRPVYIWHQVNGQVSDDCDAITVAPNQREFSLTEFQGFKRNCDHW